MKDRYDVIIIGAGAVGCAIAYTLAKFDISIAVLERNEDVCLGTSGKNSGVVHAGFNNKPGSLMAKYCVEGNIGFEALCARLDVPYSKTGKLVVGFDDEDMQIIHRILKAGNTNGCVGLELIDRARMDELMPGIGGIGALYSANTAVINPFLYTIHLAEAAHANGVDFFFNHKVKRIDKQQNGFWVHAGDRVFHCDSIVNSAGLYADEVAAMAGDNAYQVYPCRGQYYILDKCAADLVPLPVYPAPRAGVGGLGVHLTRTIDDNVIIGPSAEYVENKEEYCTTADVMEQLFSEARMLLPSLQKSMIIGSYTGIRSKIVAKGQENYGDFIIRESDTVPGLINLIGIESPGLTASIPIANRVGELLNKDKQYTNNLSYNPSYKGKPRFKDLDNDQRQALIQADPNYGELVCRCEMVTKAEVLQAVNNPLGVKSIIGIKNRLRTTMGRCQGGYCMAGILNVLVKECGIKPEEIMLRQKDDKPFIGWAKHADN